MDNQHMLIKGYRDLTQEEIDMMNSIKDIGSALKELTDYMRNVESYDQRWISIGITDIQKGIMALIRGVAKPESF